MADSGPADENNLALSPLRAVKPSGSMNIFGGLRGASAASIDWSASDEAVRRHVGQRTRTAGALGELPRLGNPATRPT